MESLVSIITPAFNSEKYILQTIASVREQTHKNWEMIIIDDGSTDKTVSLIEEIQKDENRIILLCLDENGGPGIARNEGLKLAKGKYISFLDADDLWLPKKLEIQLKFLKSKNLHFTFSFYDCIDEDGNLLGKRITAPNPLTYKDLLSSNFIGNLTGIYDADFFGKLPVSPIRRRQDWMLWLDILKKIKVAYPVPDSLAQYRIRKDSISNSKILLLKYNFQVYHKFLGKNAMISVFYMINFLWFHFFIRPGYVIKYKKIE